MKNLLPVLFFAFALLACKKETEETDPEPVFYPTEITRTVSGSSEVELLRYTYNAQNQVTREDILLQNVLQRYRLYTYSQEGKVTKKQTFNAAGRLLEQDENFYTSSQIPEKIRHSYADANGNPQLHHTRNFEFYADGRLKRWTDLAPDNEVISSRSYTYREGSAVVSIEINGQGKFLNKIEQVYDGLPDPYKNTAVQLIPFAGNELLMELKDENEQVISTSFSTYTYHENGFPVKRTQTLNTGEVKTEIYVYKSE